MSEGNQGGRPSDLVPEVVTKLEAAFHNAFNVTEACATAGISRTSFYRWMESSEWFRDKMVDAQSALNRTAKSKLKEAIEANDLSTIRWYLDRRDPDFKSKAEVELSPGAQATEEKLKEFMDDPDDDAYDDQRVEPTASPESEGGDEVAPSA